MTTTFKQLFEAKKLHGATGDGAKSLFKEVVRKLKPEMSDWHGKNGDWWSFMIRDYKYFTPRPGEEDDDWPDFTGAKEFESKMKRIMQGFDWDYSPEEKDWISINVKDAESMRPAKAAKKDKGKKTKALAKGAANDATVLYGPGEQRVFMFQLSKALTKVKRTTIPEDDFMAIARRVPFYDYETAKELWDTVT